VFETPIPRRPSLHGWGQREDPWLALGGAEPPSRKNLDQFLRKMATDRFQVFGRRAGQQNGGPHANLPEAPEFVEEFQNYFGMKRRTELIGHAEVPLLGGPKAT
jgi:hypothetical protein